MGTLLSILEGTDYLMFGKSKLTSATLNGTLREFAAQIPPLEDCLLSTARTSERRRMATAVLRQTRPHFRALKPYRRQPGVQEFLLWETCLRIVADGLRKHPLREDALDFFQQQRAELKSSFETALA